MAAQKSTFYISIVHNHGSKDGMTIGKIQAVSHDDAEERSQFWVRRRKQELDCCRFGDICRLRILSKDQLTVKQVAIFIVAEEINYR